MNERSRPTNARTFTVLSVGEMSDTLSRPEYDLNLLQLDISSHTIVSRRNTERGDYDNRLNTFSSVNLYISWYEHRKLRIKNIFFSAWWSTWFTHDPTHRPWSLDSNRWTRTSTCINFVNFFGDWPWPGQRHQVYWGPGKILWSSVSINWSSFRFRKKFFKDPVKYIISAHCHVNHPTFRKLILQFGVEK